MLLFLNIDCVLDPPADAVGPDSNGATGVRRLEAVLRAWPHLQVVVTSERRYRMTLAHFRGFVAAELRHRLIATTLLYGTRAQAMPRRTREDEVLDWLNGSTSEAADWLALDSCANDFVTHADRLLPCMTLTRGVVLALHAQLLRRAGDHAAIVHAVSDTSWQSGGTESGLPVELPITCPDDPAAKFKSLRGDPGEWRCAPWLVPRTSIQRWVSSRNCHAQAVPSKTHTYSTPQPGS
jgi:hypothetical protein